ncbi:MAG: hypothetical protein BGO41_08865 [Clostridiales bacterium 38-18]|nr:MAG: hypothetical protein BGO41_08865 [Clostridiales bacterium 38-18]
MTCRTGCGACCIVPSITTKTPKLPNGKAAGVPCPHLDHDLRCSIFSDPDRPKVCASLQPSVEMCGNSKEAAIAYLNWLEDETSPK